MNSSKPNEAYFDRIFQEFRSSLNAVNKVLPAVSYIAVTHNEPYAVLVSTLLSLRTKDNVTLEASQRLFSKASTPKEMILLSAQEIEKLIFPVGFYKTKAARILELSSILIEKYDGKVPDTQEELMALPGVGLKTANLTLNLGFNVNAICVDCHVHQISNRMGWVQTKTPEETEEKLKGIMPERFWIPLNELLVSYGQEICTSISPKCSMCIENASCPKIGVSKSR